MRQISVYARSNLAAPGWTSKGYKQKHRLEAMQLAVPGWTTTSYTKISIYANTFITIVRRSTHIVDTTLYCTSLHLLKLHVSDRG